MEKEQAKTTELPVFHKSDETSKQLHPVRVLWNTCCSGTPVSHLIFLFLLMLLFSNRSTIVDGDLLSTLKQCSECEELFTSVASVNPIVLKSNSCKLKDYDSVNFRKCFDKKKSTIAVAGDSRVREVFNSMWLLSQNKLNNTLDSLDSVKLQDGNTQMNFFSRAYLEKSIHKLLSSWLRGNHNDQPDLFIIGIDTWNLKATSTAQWFSEYQNKLENISSLLDALNEHTPVIWVSQDPIFTKDQSFWTGKSEEITEYHRITSSILKNTKVTFWKSANDITSLLLKDNPQQATNSLRNIIANFYCNLKMEETKEYCCANADACQQDASSFTAPTVLFILATVVVVMNCIPLWFAKKVSPNMLSAISLAQHVLAFVAIILLCYIFEKLSLFPKYEKAFSYFKFYLPSIGILLLSCFSAINSPKNTVLHRDQTDEWKGWMQVIMIIYHVTGSSRNLVIYMNLRFLVSSYLVLTGYGHFMFYIQGGSLSFSRVFQVIFRMNFLTTVLCITMGQQYQFYYFIPLVTFWYLIVCLALLIPPRVTLASLAENPKYYLYLLSKLLIVGIIITALDSSETLFEYFFSFPIWRRFFTYHDSLKHWQFRWSLDRYTSMFGILLGIIATAIGRSSFKQPHVFRLCCTAAASVGLLVPTALGLFSSSKPAANELHSLLFFIPVVSFIYLRNITEWIRQRYSWIMAWCGRVSLELFLLQHHLWMTDSTEKVLQLLPVPFLNAAVLTLLITTTSSVTQAATEKITQSVFALIDRKETPKTAGPGTATTKK